MMRRSCRIAAAATTALALWLGGHEALAQKLGGILKMPDFASPASMSIHEEVTRAAVTMLMPVTIKGDDEVTFHLEGVDSEDIVRSTHSTQSNPYTIEEVRRIPLLHAADVCRPIACGQQPGPSSAGTQALTLR
jgi:hypothetical protein